MSFYAQKTYFICIKQSSLHSSNLQDLPNSTNSLNTCQTRLREYSIFVRLAKLASREYLFFQHTRQTRLARVSIFDILAKLNSRESQHQHKTRRRRVRKYSREYSRHLQNAHSPNFYFFIYFLFCLSLISSLKSPVIFIMVNLEIYLFTFISETELTKFAHELPFLRFVPTDNTFLANFFFPLSFR
jgi:hypothetical protein